MASPDSDPCPQRDAEQKLDKEQEKTTGDILRENWVTDLNNNATTKIDSGEVAVSATVEPLVAKEDSSGAEHPQTGTEASSDNGNEGGGTFSDEQIPIQTPSQRDKPEKKSNGLPETENYQEVSGVVLKCEHIFCQVHALVFVNIN